MNWLQLLKISQLVDNFEVLPRKVSCPCGANAVVPELLVSNRKFVNLNLEERRNFRNHNNEES